MSIFVGRFISRFLAGGGLVVLSAGSALSQTAHVTAEELTRKADVVAVGRVSDLRAEWTENRSRIVTRVTLSVDSFLKGANEGASLTMVVPGGEVDGIGEVYSDMPVFNRDEQVLIFAQKETRGDYRVTGGHEGKIAIERDKTTGRAMVFGNRTLEEMTTRIRNTVKIDAGK